MTAYDDNSLSIGQTPLVKINRIGNGNIYAKIESRNPANSVKCRIGANMIWQAEKEGALKPGMEIVEPTSGNTGIALCFVAASKGYSITLVMPHTMSLERRQLMKALGANIIITDAAKGMKLCIETAQSMVAQAPDKRWMPSQFDNPANPAIHERTTGPEIWEDTNGGIDILVSGVGTGGTLTGISRYIKNTKGKAITSVAVEPITTTMITAAKAGMEPSHAPHKIQGIGAGFVPANLDLSMVDEVAQVSDDDAIEYAHRLMKEEGILAGISSGAAMAVADRVCKQPENKDKIIVVILPDSAERYLSTALFAGQFSDNETVQ
ncbi:cysteine synthase A [Oceanicoccus sp. KOV_DT_Chl]|uniref:cysteine synthase A n=1 Tax=Oceanicoccus sp. KOV_DT_Chl TaxID=1904639 RepID=UPI000C7A583C|nr:cysteine synthase A [Oceanicoccus sp. KOV_DT_Chl]